MTYALRYHPDTDLGRRFPHWVIATFRTREAAVAVRQQCASAASIEVVEVLNPPVKQGETGKISPQVKTAPGVGVSAPTVIPGPRQSLVRSDRL